jgi:hypothetical protein
MNLEAFKNSLVAGEPPAGIGPPLQALWYAANGDWSRAHDVAQEHDDARNAWVHAYLHRLEGDDENARYWYGKAGRPPSTATRDEEWEEIVTHLLAE